MSVVTYRPTIDRIIDRYEGGYVWNRRDPGGPTKFGVTCWDLAAHRGQKMDSMTRWAPIVAAMSRDEAEDIYQTKYANFIHYNDLPAGPDAVMLDYAINSGISRPIIVARRMFNLPGSYRMDQTLLDAIKKADPVWFCKTMCAERLQFMHAIRHGEAWAEFGGGWQHRVDDLEIYAKHLATEPTAPAPPAVDLTKIVMPKVKHEPKTAGKSTTAGAIAAAAATHAAGFDPKWIALAFVGVFVLGIVYEAWEDHKATAANRAVLVPAIKRA